MSIRCLMLQTVDKKRLFTLIGNYRRLVECCRAFKAKMFVVKADIKRSQVMDIPGLVAALCDKGGAAPKAKYEIIEKKKV